MHFKYSPATTLQLLLTTSIWGSLYVGSRILLEYISPMLLLLFRFGISSVLLLSIARFRGMKMIEKRDLPKVILIGLVGYFTANTAITISIKLAGSSFAALFNAMNPICITLFASLILKEKITRLDLASMLVGVAGASVIIGNPGDSVTMPGIIAAIIGLVTWALNVVIVRSLGNKYNAIVITGAGMAVAAVCLLPASMPTWSEAVFTPHMILPLIYVVLVCTTLSHFLWNHALAKCDASYCASFYPMQPLVSMLLGIVLFSERLTPSFLFGTALILVAMILHSRSGKPKK